MSRSSVWWLLFAAVTILMLGRVLGSPVALILVSGRSMEPTLHVGDIVVGIRGLFKPGDIVVWCSSLTYCVIHRVINVSDGEVVLKGDNNAFPDPPVRKEEVRYRVLGVIPRYVWLPPVITLAAFIIYRGRRTLFYEFEPGKIASLTLTIFVLFSTVVVFITPISSSMNMIWGQVPNVWLIDLESLPDGSVVIHYGMKNTELAGVEGCYIQYGGGERVWPCDAYWVGEEVRVTPPNEALTEMYLEGANSYVLSLNVTLSEGRLVGRYRVGLKWRKLDLSVNSSAIVVRNPNPVPVNVSVIFSVLLPNYSVITLERDLTVGGFGVAVIPAPAGEDVRVTLQYLFMGEEVRATYRLPR